MSVDSGNSSKTQSLIFVNMYTSIPKCAKDVTITLAQLKWLTNIIDLTNAKGKRGTEKRSIIPLNPKGFPGNSALIM